MDLRPAVEADIAQMMALAEQSPSAAHWTHADYARIFASAPDAKRTALVAESSGSADLAGFIVGYSIPGEYQWEIENVVVANSHQRAGIGSRLLQELIDCAKQKNARRIFLEVRQSNAAAIGLYRKYGFAETGVRKNYYLDPTEDAVILSLTLFTKR